MMTMVMVAGVVVAALMMKTMTMVIKILRWSSGERHLTA